MQFPCQVCGERLATRNSLSTHLKSHLLSVCMCCLRIWDSAGQLKAHQRNMSRDTLAMVTVTSRYGRRRNVLRPIELFRMMPRTVTEEEARRAVGVSSEDEDKPLPSIEPGAPAKEEEST